MIRCLLEAKVTAYTGVMEIVGGGAAAAEAVINVQPPLAKIGLLALSAAGAFDGSRRLRKAVVGAYGLGMRDARQTPDDAISS